MKRFNASTRKRRAGNVLVVVAIAMVGLLGFAALAIDYAYLIVSKDELRRASDSAALAAAWEIGVGCPYFTACSFAGKNKVAGDHLTLGYGDVVLGSFNFTTAAFSPSVYPEEQHAVRVRGRRSVGSPDGPLPVFFASALGIPHAEISVNSVAAIDRRVSGIVPNALSPLMPFLANADTFGGISGGALQAPIGAQVDFYPQRDDAPGNFGLANLDGGENATSELVAWIRNGYPDTVEIPSDADYLMVEGNPGFVAAMKEAVESRIGDTIVVMIYDQVTDNGSNSLFRVPTFCAVELTDARITGSVHNSYIRGIIREVRSSAVCTSPGRIVNNTLGVIRLVQ